MPTHRQSQKNKSRLNVRLFLARHGQTVWNAQIRLQGQEDIPLDETGERQAAALARRLAKIEFAAIYSSDLQRAWATASAVAAQHTCPLIAEPRLREMNFGVWQGMTYAEIQASDPGALADWETDRMSKSPPGGETLLQLGERVQAALAAILAAYPERTVLVVAHGGALQMLVCRALGLCHNAYWQFHLANASLSEICFYPDGAMLNLLNDTSHLGGQPVNGKVLMVQGTSSSAGKSLLTAALCRIYARQGVRVAPFKAQNMSNNAAVCADGSEIGRAQAVQAAAAGIDLTVDMNPVLIKPEADARSQVILMGRPYHTLSARAYYDHKQVFWACVTAALDRLRAQYELVIVEGAGSPAEINLRAGDIVNMAVAQYAQSPVLLVGDIDREGIFAQLLGTLWLLEPEERSLVRGLIADKFRGDLGLFTDGVRMLDEKGGLPVLGVIPFLKDLRLPEEDAVALDDPTWKQKKIASPIDLAVIHLPHISNFDDFDPFNAEPGVSLRYVTEPEALGRPQAIILPGTKSTVADLDWLRTSGLAKAISEHAGRGGAVVGICGGYQMLGEEIVDPLGMETPVEKSRGLGLLPIQTVFEPEKATYQARARIKLPMGWMAGLEGQTLEGYEIHMGRTQGSQAWLEIISRNGAEVKAPDGARSPDGRIWGCYLHGIFSNPGFRQAWLVSLGWTGEQPGTSAEAEGFEESLNWLADEVESALDMQKLEAIIWGISR